ncbi:hypothetical protein [[Phormidium] sp. ETS-05]|nr:hypothetical protein [[Phormidium] sp. ETS-05]
MSLTGIDSSPETNLAVAIWLGHSSAYQSIGIDVGLAKPDILPNQNIYQI